MPKALSLKKVSGPAKNQKSITAFFTNSNGNQKTGTSKSVAEPTKPQQGTPLKRKASSPLNNDAKHYMPPQNDTKIIENGITTGIKEEKVSPMKKETDLKHKGNIIKENHVNLLCLEQDKCDSNNFKIIVSNSRQSPRKAKNSNDRANKKISSKPLLNDHAEAIAKNKSRIPLSAIKSEQIENKNHVDRIENSTKDKNTDGVTESCSKMEIKISPKKKDIKSPGRIQKTTTPKKSPVAAPSELRRSPRIAKLQTPDKAPNKSPIKNASSVKVALDFDNVDDMFGDDWGNTDLVEECSEDLDLSTMQRCEVVSVEHQGGCKVLRLKGTDDKQATCSIEGIWSETPVTPGEIISIIASRDPTGRFAVTTTSGLLVLRSDHLMSTTSVVAGVFCRRKAVLQERFKGVDSANSAMTMGILIHELVQIALTSRLSSLQDLRATADTLIAQSTQMLYDAGLTVEETRMNMEIYLAPLSEFMRNYVVDKPGNVNGQKKKWNGHIDEILDIEENVCCPQLGLKGKIDATLQVTIHERKGMLHEYFMI
ncbi:DNA replication ATP-dependent helicase/nuclease dna2-like [Plutella xylostella]|uniref:DNA replication ATP-dependent helicase/nuclease dna2-like n=1 Tax=Plutella xylostella TaxID=51655 RepID=UPI002032AC6D|nr:DNA replication ATP-dependent helicase/nuclease dna2-like [Plutella xylostella]